MHVLSPTRSYYMKLLCPVAPQGLMFPARTHRVRVQVLLLAQPVQERSLLLEQGLPRCEEHRSADVQPDPLAVVPPVGVDDRAVSDALRRRPAGFGGCYGGGGGPAQCGLHGDERKRVSVWETLMSREVEGLP
ncbi:hypothetical protein XENOCAPTIV_001873 [Xenoophorus captivus]|uniref:Uncharacterized protein n=1 Tax=Xenoophorus captivus TaxID=1517983 RepID=A0ABV0QXZ2_9TELE